MSPLAQMTRTALPAPRDVVSFAAGGPRCPHDGRPLLLIAGQLVCQDCEASWNARGLHGRWPAQSVRRGRRIAAVAAVLVAVAALVLGGLYSAPAAEGLLAVVADAVVWAVAAVLAAVAAVLLAIGARQRGGRR
jgi:hypothetical protein